MKNSYSLVDFAEQFGTGEEGVGKLKSKMIELKLSGNSLFKEFLVMLKHQQWYLYNF